jgi:hypothetical protein
MSDSSEPVRKTDDDDLPVSITHSRDTITFAGTVAQDYRYLTYHFGSAMGGVEATMYLDDPWTVTITLPPAGTPIPDAVLAYFVNRFTLVQQLGGPDGPAELWSKPLH